ncbi:MAG: hypothetical protein A2445_01825 [Candidatus Jacksonbacteria bacterium RIFOXYC2_FULL_44_29]|nr:MAG: Aminotransferase, class V superfamily [Parcubacteria group bacterium GW2011_GWC2_44_22]OGY75596.1 MAG: hypothetical protein A2295_05250 [Candidatus Jacksonbacteria bacterium RIFOXYB2_FULL_44_15]OGY75690.1 MAG: hypothetical protein A2240_04025 [Candidatus Jacksonbacteria bacterium RIFOXYA2_FULL_43_12]OGY77584.1 MAG: hypothetical protein A2445_01825 [Candidatus Jacksonbacteria bacterium RIFOXYC2_FULL_44_29]OGY81744.1 MAG: hypothetical protein A2550_01075 [Candidatus Jacksonbacteria bacter
MIYFTPGPSQLFPTVPGHLHRALADDIGSISHRGSKFEAIFADAVTGLKKVMAIPDEYAIFFVGSATEAMSLLIENCAGTASFHFINGAFAERFYETAVELRKKSQKVVVPWGQGFDFSAVKISEPAELICLTQNETSTGVALPMAEIYALKKRYPDKLVAIDVVSSAPDVRIDFNQIDAALFSVQKGFGLPAGLGVLIVNQKCLAKSRALEEAGFKVGSFHKFSSLNKAGAKNQTPETPNVLGIYLLGRVCHDLLAIGLDKIRVETTEKARMMYDFFAERESYNIFVHDHQLRSKTVIVVDVKSGSEGLIKNLTARGFLIGAGYKNFKNQQIRIANFPAHQISDVGKMLKHLEI